MLTWHQQKSHIPCGDYNSNSWKKAKDDTTEESQADGQRPKCRSLIKHGLYFWLLELKEKFKSNQHLIKYLLNK